MLIDEAFINRNANDASADYADATAGAGASADAGAVNGSSGRWPAFDAASKELAEALAVLKRREAAMRQVEEAIRRGREAAVSSMRAGGSSEAMLSAINTLRAAVDEAKEAKVDRETITAAQQLLTSVRAKAVAMGLR